MISKHVRIKKEKALQMYSQRLWEINKKKSCLKFVEEKEQREIKIGRNGNGKYKNL